MTARASTKPVSNTPVPPPPGISTEALRECVSRARHDLRNPLGHILGFSEILVEEARNRGFDHFVADFEAISESANQMMAEISRRLDSAAVRSGNENPVILKKQITSLASKIIHTATSLSHLATALKEDVFSPDLGRIASSAKHLLDLAESSLGFWPLKGIDSLPRLDTQVAAPPKLRPERPTAADLLFQPGKEGTILVVDDLESNRELLLKRLSRLGYKVELAETGRHALEWIAANLVDLVLLDVIMPELDGFQTLAALKDNPSTRYIPVIMLSSSDDVGTVVQCIKLGADDFLPKPFNTTLLLARIESALAKKRLRELNATQKSFFFDKGTLQPTSPSYVERQADRDLLQSLLKNEFCYVLTSRQMGKSSLMARTASKLREQGINVVALDLTAIGQNLTPEQWYDGLVIRLGRQLRIEDELDDFWATHDRLSPVQRFFTALRDVAMQQHRRPLVVFIDELDTVRSLPFCTDEFFAAIRECYNRRSEDPEFRRLSFCLL
ncbi:MAG: response regulator, partial [Verrucomicrobiales bacterium]|nr:response regulator [Verrucomicrobiales bacterium]